MKNFDFLIVGAGLFGSVFAYEARKRGKSCLVIDRRNHIGGNCYTEEIEGIPVHRYGAHIFRTADRSICQYLLQFCDLNHFVNSPIANYHGELYNLPFNMNTFNKLWGVVTPKEAQNIINKQRQVIQGIPKNLEEQAISLVGTDIYEKLVKGYTEKQWGRACSDLPPSIIKRLPVRFTYDNNYYNDPYQGIPIGGYTRIFEKLLNGCEVKLNIDYNEERGSLNNTADCVIYTGKIDAYYNYEFGILEYRSLRFDTQLIACPNYQGVAVMNYTDRETPYTRVIEHKHFEFGCQDYTVVSFEYPQDHTADNDAYYPIEDELNRSRYLQYAELASKQCGLFFGGRLGEYRYYDMQDTISSALRLSKKLL